MIKLLLTWAYSRTYLIVSHHAGIWVIDIDFTLPNIETKFSRISKNTYKVIDNTSKQRKKFLTFSLVSLNILLNFDHLMALSSAGS